MPFFKVEVCLVIDEHNKTHVVEKLQTCIDVLVKERVPIFDSDIKCTHLTKVEGADEIRSEMALPGPRARKRF